MHTNNQPSRKGLKRGEPYKYKPEVEDRIVAYYGKMKPQEIANKLEYEFGYTFTEQGVIQYATQILGLRTADAQGDLCVSDAARELGIAKSTLFMLIKRKGLEVKGSGSGYCRFLTPDTWRAVQAYYQTPPEPTMSLQDAATRLKRSLDWTYNQVRAQRLKAYKHGANWRVSQADVERFYWDQIRSKR